MSFLLECMHPRSVGGYDKEEKAARAYDLAALKYWGTTTTTNFPVSSKKRILKHFTYFVFVEQNLLNVGIGIDMLSCTCL